jgi:hypothetical protein
MSREDIQKLLGGYATGTLTPEEQQTLFEAALEDQELFDSLAREQSLRDLLRDPAARAHLLATLDTPPPRWYQRFLRPLPIAAVAALAAAAVIVIRQLAPLPPPTTFARLTPPPAPSPSVVGTPPAPPAESAPAFARPSRVQPERSERKDALVPPPTARSSAAAAPPIPASSPTPAALVGGAIGGRAGSAGAPQTAAALGGAATSFFGVNAQITGLVKDPSGSAIPGANVKARDLTNGVVHTTVTNTDGQFNLPAVPPGKYEVQVASSGFKTALSQVNVNNSDQAVVNATLNVGASTETIEVTTEPAKLEDLKKALVEAQNTALPFTSRSAPISLVPAVQYTVLRQTSNGTFVDVGSAAEVAAGTPLKLRIVPNGTGSLRIRESTPDGDWRDLASRRVERGKPFDTPPRSYQTGTQRFEVSLVPDVVPIDGVPQQQQSQSTAGQQQSRMKAAQSASSAPPRTVTITVNIR